MRSRGLRRQSKAARGIVALAAVLVVAALCVFLAASAAQAAERAPPFLFAANAESEVEMAKRAEQLYIDGRYDEARALAEQGLAISEKAHGPDGANVAWWLNQLALVLEAQGRYAQAEPLFKRALAIRERILGPDHPDTAIVLNNLAGLYDSLGRYAEAEPLYKRALAINEKAFGPDHPKTATNLNNLGLLYMNQGRYAEAEPLLKRALAISEKTEGAEHPGTATSLLNLANLYFEQGRFAEAEQLQKRALAIDEKVYGPDHPETATALNNLAELYRVQGRFAEAEPLFKRALAIDERARGPNSPDVALDLSNLGALYDDLGRYADAEVHLKRALAIYESAFGSDHPLIANALTNLASVYHAQGRLDEAEPLYRRALAIDEKLNGPDHPNTATSLNNLAGLYLARGRIQDAEALYRRALAIYEKTYGPEHERTGLALNNLAALYQSTKRYAEALPLAKRALAIYEDKLGPDHPSTAMSVGVLASIDRALGNLAEAEALFRRGVAIFERIYPPTAAENGTAKYWLSVVLLERGKVAEALAMARRAVEVLANRRARATAARLRGQAGEQLSYEDYFLQFVRAAYAAARSEPRTEAALRLESFEAAQLQATDETEQAVARMASGFAAGSDKLALLLREQQDLLKRLPAIERLIANALGSSDPATRAQADVFRRESARVEVRLGEIDATLRRDHTAYADLVDPKPAKVGETQALLRPDEAVVFMVSGAQETFLFAVSKFDIRWAKSAMNGADLVKHIAALRRQLDPAQWQGSFAPFDRALSHRLYRELWAPLESVLKDKTQVFVATTGPLTSFPLSVLVTEEPKGGVAGDADPQALRDTAWLIKRHALTTLPSISSLKALRVYANKASGSEPFVGFGDPALGAPANARVASRSVASVFRGQNPDPSALRELSPLPQTAGELKALAKALGATDADVYLRERATEAQIKSLDLSKKRVIAFATHGLMAGDMGLGEPGLVFTPPGAPSERDDGYLGASEAARLNLKADWIILSACNTAAGDAPGAKGLSGLARAFFLAGSKSLLVSHWPVWDNVAMRLTTGAVTNMQKNLTAGRAEALRQSMLAVMNDASAPYFAHPAAWAPFVLVGETRAN